MARTKQKLINFHGSSVLSAATLLNLGEIAVVHGDKDPRLGIKTTNGALVWFIDSAATVAIVSAATSDVSKKADKVSGATNGNFAGLDANGNLTDSGKKASDFALSSHTHAWADITATPTTLSGYGITDANIADNVITLGSQTITVATSADTYNAINAVNESLTAFSATVVSTYATSADTHNAIEASKGELSAFSATVVSTYATSANTVNAITAATKEAKDYSDGALSAFSGVVVTTYATSANTYNAIEASKGELSAFSATVVSTYATSAATVSAISAATIAAENYSDGKLSAFSATVVSTYATSADTHNAIEASKGELSAFSATVVSTYATSANTVNAITAATKEAKDYSDGALSAFSGVVVSTYATSADTYNAIQAISASAVTGVTLNGVDFDVTDNKATATIYASGITLGQNIVYSGQTLAYASNTVVEAISAVTNQMVANEKTTAEALNNLNDKFGNYATSAATVAALNNKVDKETGKSLVSNTEITKLATVAASAQVNTIEVVKVNGSALTITESDKSVDIAVPSYVLTAVTTTSGMAKTYALYKDGVQAGDKIDIAKDMFVSSGGVVEVDNKKYVRLYLANSAGTSVDIAVSDLAHVYTGNGSAITISASDVIGLVIDPTSGNVTLTQSATGLKASVDLSAYVTSARTIAGVDLADDITAAELLTAIGVESGAQVNKIETVQLNGSPLTITGKTVNVTAIQSVTLGTVETADKEQSGAKIATADNAVTLDLNALEIDCGSWD